MNLETIWKLLILLAAIAAVIAVVQLDWSIGRVSLIFLAVTLAPTVLLGGAYGLIMLFASDHSCPNRARISAASGFRGTKT